MTMTAVTDAPMQTPLGIRIKLSIMMFLQYAIWGAWLPLFFPFLSGYRHLTPVQIGNLFSIAAVGALVAPFISGQIADRYFNTEKFLAISHIVGAVLVWQLAKADTYSSLLVYSILYSLVYAPTLALTNSLAFHHLVDRDRDFGKVRVWGTVGWIAVGIGIGQWLLHRHTPPGTPAGTLVTEQFFGMGDAFRLSAILGVVMGIYCLMLPPTPPARGKQEFAPGEALKEIRFNPLLTLFIVAFPISIVHQFYFVHTPLFLGQLKSPYADSINSIFGVGGGGLMTVGQISEICVLAIIPLFAKSLGRKTLLTIGILAYIVRFLIFAYLNTNVALVIFGVAMHGLCFGCFFFVAFMIVDEQTTKDVRASAQGLFNLVIVGLGTIAGNLAAGLIGKAAQTGPNQYNYALLFGIPMFVSIASLLILLIAYPKRSVKREDVPGFEVVQA